MPTDQEIALLHQTYCQQSGLDIMNTMGRRYYWEAFIAQGFTADDLVLVCRNLNRQIKDGRRSLTCLGFRRLIADLEVFEEFLAEFRALQRRKQYTGGKSQVLRMTNRPAEPAQPEPQLARNVLAKKFRQLGEDLDKQP